MQAFEETVVSLNQRKQIEKQI